MKARLEERKETECKTCEHHGDCHCKLYNIVPSKERPQYCGGWKEKKEC